ncbi:hypothetical protein LEP1GSC008_0010 [Leptospira kirschneri serovar Bulgarica str. Nikolaevo]|uniref:Uncharacterized protein n=1 Tax=Leptospira kirschneri serovar Bulgarica str. Nikolaevo TaxID=1240687 RepID=M6F990_9LEPT|nr:hypothetical protein LEP1GSC008_0010 [Leptospira kirschneri serovar Bulgarica str. Nikolaevo]
MQNSVSVQNTGDLILTLVRPNAKGIDVGKLKQNVLYHNQPHKLNRILESKLNSSKTLS